MLLSVDVADFEARLRVELREFAADVQPGRRDRTDAAPGSIARLEDAPHNGLGRAVALTLDRSSVLVLDDRPTLFELADRHQDPLEQIERLKARHHDRHAVLGRDRLVLGPAHDRTNVTGREKRLNLACRRVEDRRHRRRHQNVADEHAEVAEAEFRGLPDRHRVGRRSRFEADREEDDLPVRVRHSDLHGVQRRVHDPHVRATSLERQQVRRRARYAQHVAVAREDHVRPGRDRERLVDLLQRRDADGTAGAVDHPHALRQRFVDPLLHERMRLAAANFHQRPRLSRDSVDLA